MLSIIFNERPPQVLGSEGSPSFNAGRPPVLYALQMQKTPAHAAQQRAVIMDVHALPHPAIDAVKCWVVAKDRFVITCVPWVGE